MVRVIINCLIILCIFGCQAQTPTGNGTQPVSHEIWNHLLQAHVDKKGMVDYRGFIRDKEKLEAYLEQVSTHPPDPETWSKNEQLAYWINAYNAFAIKLIADNYPVESIQELQPAFKIPLIYDIWHKKFFKIGSQKSSLHEIEHGIIRKQFAEPRIHFAINCASFSCPPLRNEAFTAEKLDQQLEEQAIQFINDPERNKISPNEVEISRIFSWFTGDFTNDGSLIDFLNQYTEVPVNEDAEIDYMHYDWSLNEQP